MTSLFIKSFKGKLRVLAIDRLRKITINKGREKKAAADVNEVGIKKKYSQPFLNERRCLTCNYGLLYSKPLERLNIICTFLMLPPSSASYHYHMLHSLSRTLEKLYTDLVWCFFLLMKKEISPSCQWICMESLTWSHLHIKIPKTEIDFRIFSHNKKWQIVWEEQTFSSCMLRKFQRRW